jgi:hypothetical protein
MIEKLSDCTIKAYMKRNGVISFHFRSHIFIRTKMPYSVTTYLNNLKSYFILENGEKINFDSMSVVDVPFIPYNGKYIVTEIHFTTISKLTKVESCLVDLHIFYSLFGHPCVDPNEFKCKALVKWMY